MFGEVTSIVQNFLFRRVLAMSTVLLVLPALLTACSDEASNNDSSDDPALAAHAAFVLWGASRGIEMRNVFARTVEIDGDFASARVEAFVRDSPSDAWRQLAVTIPVKRDQPESWQISPTPVVDRLVQAVRVATAVADAPTAPTSGLSPTREPAPTTPILDEHPTPPPPPEGAVVYQSDWSNGFDGWIGTPDWKVADGVLVNDGSRSSRDPWLEAPIQIEPWQSMIVEFQAEAPVSDFGSFGLIARGGTAGWYELGLRWEDFARGSGTPVVTLGARIRQDTRRVYEEMLAERKPLTAGPHLYRIEFRDGAIRFFVDGRDIGAIQSDQFYAGEFLGLWSERTPLKVYFFRVTLV